MRHGEGKKQFLYLQEFSERVEAWGKKNERDLREAWSARMDGKALFVFFVK